MKEQNLKQFGLIDRNAPPASVRLVDTYDDPYQKYYTYIYVGDNLIIFNIYHNRPTKHNLPVNQLEFPLAGLPWLVDSIENKFWKKPEEGGLDGVFHVLATMEGELLRIGRMAHAGAENVPGFNLSNHGRGGYIDETSPQHHAIADAIMKEGGLFERLKKLSERVRAGEFGP